jgi:hypothetical protein
MDWISLGLLSSSLAVITCIDGGRASTMPVALLWIRFKNHNSSSNRTQLTAVVGNQRTPQSYFNG